jgi:hypothetical protein
MKNKPQYNNIVKKPARTQTIVLWVLHGICCIGLALFFGGAVPIQLVTLSTGYAQLVMGKIPYSASVRLCYGKGYMIHPMATPAIGWSQLLQDTVRILYPNDPQQLRMKI